MGLIRQFGRPILGLLLVVAAVPAPLGCGPSTPQTAPPPARKVAWDEYQKLSPDQKTDPHVAENLDDDARKKLADQQKKRRR